MKGSWLDNVRPGTMNDTASCFHFVWALDCGIEHHKLQMICIKIEARVVKIYKYFYMHVSEWQKCAVL